MIINYSENPSDVTACTEGGGDDQRKSSIS